MNELRRLLPGETAFGWLALAFSLFLFYHSYKIAGFSSLSSSGGTPLAASGLMIISSVIVHPCATGGRRPPGAAGMAEAARRFHKRDPAGPSADRLRARHLRIHDASRAARFNLTSCLFLFVSFWYLHRRGGIWLAAWLSLVSVLIIYVLFQLVFQVTLPEGDWLGPLYRLIGR